MGMVRVACFAISADGFGAGPGQSLDNPLGAGGLALHEWAFATRSFQSMLGKEGGSTGVDDGLMVRGMQNLGAWVMGRNMFGPVRGPWPDESWKGWWGPKPPYHTPVFVLTHHARAPIEMEGGTTFHFVTEGIAAALEKARRAAGDKDVRIGGGPATIRQYLAAKLIDEMHLVATKVQLGSGEKLLDGIDPAALGYRVAETVQGERATHLVVRRAA
jgi:dihydrofolate reductase